MELTVWPAEEFETQAISELVGRSFLAHGSAGWTDAAIQTFLQESSPGSLAGKLLSASVALVVHSSSGPVGFALMPRPSSLSMLFVEPNYQRRGVGRALWLACLSSARAAASDLGAISLNSTAFAVPFYESVGFVAQGPEFEHGGCRATRMLLQLAGTGTMSFGPSIDRTA